jgi:hypothetical protein
VTPHRQAATQRAVIGFLVCCGSRHEVTEKSGLQMKSPGCEEGSGCGARCVSAINQLFGVITKRSPIFLDTASRIPRKHALSSFEWLIGLRRKDIIIFTIFKMQYAYVPAVGEW